MMVDTEKKKEPTNSQRPMLVVLPRTMSPFLYASMMPWGRGCSDHQALWGNGSPAPKHTHTHTHTTVLVTTLISALSVQPGLPPGQGAWGQLLPLSTLEPRSAQGISLAGRTPFVLSPVHSHSHNKPWSGPACEASGELQMKET